MYTDCVFEERGKTVWEEQGLWALGFPWTLESYLEDEGLVLPPGKQGRERLNQRQK